MNDWINAITDLVVKLDARLLLTQAWLFVLTIVVLLLHLKKGAK